MSLALSRSRISLRTLLSPPPRSSSTTLRPPHNHHAHAHAHAHARSPLLRRTYATNLKAPRDRSITAHEISFIDENGTFQGLKSLSSILSSYSTASHTLINLTPTNPLPTCRLYSLSKFHELEMTQYRKSRDRSKGGADPGKTLKECSLSWTVTDHDLSHKLDPIVTALRKGNKVDVSIGVKTKRHAKVTTRESRERLVKAVEARCVELGRERKEREGDLESGVVLHYLGSGGGGGAAAAAATQTAKKRREGEGKDGGDERKEE